MADACVDEMLLDATRGHIGQVPLFDVLECKSRKLEVAYPCGRGIHWSHAQSLFTVHPA
ncbi:hypothetical protein TRIUR3_34109 [Triticum urartu]|uniref:Uncharacterized protein n=1 Tax=Triticum urartu TaxID=4572 RepID=M8AP03_TRIUA|nr:hypothetical protein TRIUR3_34109 [Triticum urartu]